MSVLLKAIYRLRANSYEHSNDVFHRNRKKKILKCVWNHKRLTSQNNLRKAGGILIPDFKLHHGATVMKTVWVLLLFSCSVLSNSLHRHELHHARSFCPPLPSPGACSNSRPLNW